MTNLKKLLLLASILSVSVILFQFCSKDSPAEPEEKPTETLTTKNIGSSGGSIKTDNLEIIIPSGSFKTSQEIKISESTVDNLFSTNAVSDFYILDGLPSEFTESIKVKIKSKGTLSDSTFISIGEHNFISTLNEETTAYRLINAKDSAGYLIATIPPMLNQALGKSSNNSSVNADNLSINLGAISGYVSYKSEQGHFNINTPSSVLTQVYDLADYLETAYLKFKSIGFSYSRRTKWPVDVTIKRLNSSKGSVYGYSTNSVWGNNYGYMEFNFDMIDEAENMKVTAGHEFFHLVQALYDPRWGYSKAKSAMPNYWLDEASSVWSEAFFSGNTNFVSPIFASSAFDIFKGAKTGNIETEAEGYGYGMSSLIKYITKKYGNSKLVEIYNNISDGKTPFQSVSAVLPINVGYSWHSFLNSLLSFDIYKDNSFRPSILSSYATGEHQKFIIKSASDSMITYKSQLPDLSATIFSIDNQYNEMGQKAFLEFTCQGWNFQLYKINSSESVLIDSGKDTLTVGDYKKLTDDGYRIAAVLYNDDFDSPYSKVKPYEFKIRVLLQPPIITSITPSSGKVGTVVQINGNNFGTSQSTGEVWFGSLKASNIASWNDTQLDVTVPQGLATGDVDVHIVVNGKNSNYVNFTVLEENEPNAGYWVLYDTKPINGCEFYDSDCYPLEDCSGGAGNYSITTGSSTCGSGASGSSGSGTYTVPPSKLIPGDILTFEATASGDGYTSVWISFYSDINKMSFDDHGYNTGESSSWSNKIVKAQEDSSPAEGKYEIPQGLGKEGALLIDGGGSIGNFETSRHYFFLYKWHE